MDEVSWWKPQTTLIPATGVILLAVIKKVCDRIHGGPLNYTRTTNYTWHYATVLSIEFILHVNLYFGANIPNINYNYIFVKVLLLGVCCFRFYHRVKCSWNFRETNCLFLQGRSDDWGNIFLCKFTNFFPLLHGFRTSTNTPKIISSCENVNS